MDVTPRMVEGARLRHDPSHEATTGARARNRGCDGTWMWSAATPEVRIAEQRLVDQPMDLGLGLSPDGRWLAAEGRSNREMSLVRSIARHTASNHVSSILAKLGLESRAAAAVYAVRSGLR